MRSAPVQQQLRTRQRGVSLVELLVALTLGAVITVGIVQLFTANRQTHQVTLGQARLQENARFAMAFVERPLRMAGYAGCFSGNLDIFSALNPAGAPPPYEFDFGVPLVGHDSVGDPADRQWSPALNLLPFNTSAIEGGTDVLMIRSVDPQGLRLTRDMPVNSAVIFSQAPGDLGPFDDGSILILSDCQKATIFQSTNTTVVGGGAEISVVHNTGTGTPGNATQNLALGVETFRRDAALFAARPQAFYIAPGTGLNNRGATPLALWRWSPTAGQEELVEGVEMLQVAFGVDTDGDLVPNQYRRNAQVFGAERIVSARITIGVNSVDEVTDAVTDRGDRLLYQEFTKTIALRNGVRL